MKKLINQPIFIILFLLAINLESLLTSASTKSIEKLKITSSAFKNNGFIPTTYTCDGDNISPPIEWNIPSGTQSFALIVEDPDAPGGTFVHWVIYNLPSSTSELSSNVPKQETLENGAKQGKNSFPQIGYGGPCPPKGETHRYFFKLYALDIKLTLEGGATKGQLLKTMKKHILARAKLIGKYKSGE